MKPLKKAMRWETQHRTISITHAQRETDAFQGFEETIPSQKERYV
jgi:hypothetical protein